MIYTLTSSVRYHNAGVIKVTEQPFTLESEALDLMWSRARGLVGKGFTAEVHGARLITGEQNMPKYGGKVTYSLAVTAE